MYILNKDRTSIIAPNGIYGMSVGTTTYALFKDGQNSVVINIYFEPYNSNQDVISLYKEEVFHSMNHRTEISYEVFTKSIDIKVARFKKIMREIFDILVAYESFDMKDLYMRRNMARYHNDELKALEALYMSYNRGVKDE